MSSAIQQLKTILITEGQSITQANGYNTDIASVVPALRAPDVITKFPELGIFLGQRTFRQKDTERKIFDVDIRTHLQGVVSFDTSTDDGQTKLDEELEKFMQDMAKFISTIMSKYINADPKWNISFDNGAPEFFPFPAVGKMQNKGVIITEFIVKLRNVEGITS